MNESILELIDAFDSLRVLVIGEAMLDVYLEGSSHRLCREAPVPVVDMRCRRDAPGGAANTAANIRSLGGNVDFLSVVGVDQEAEALRAVLEQADVPTEHLIESTERQTLAKNRVVADAHMLCRYDMGTITDLEAASERRLIEKLSECFPRCDAVIVSDYGYGVVTGRVIEALRVLQSRAPRIVVADSRDVGAFRGVGITAVKPNYREAIRLLGLKDVEGVHARADQVTAYGDRILAASGAQIAAVTLDTEGALVIERNSPPYRTYARPVPQSKATGAGDTFVGGLTLALAAGGDTPAAAEIASAAAAVVVNKDGTAACFADELRSYIQPEDKVILDLSRLEDRITMLRRQQKRIIFTNGCFDILHRGHVTYLNHAKSLGDILVLGVNTDESVSRLKGPGRPINSLDDRIHILSALSGVDLIVPFAENTPEKIIEIVQPDVFVKGGDYTRSTLPEAGLVESLGGTVEILPYVEHRSTSRIIERICRFTS